MNGEPSAAAYVAIAPPQSRNVRPDRIQHDVRRPRFSFDISSTYIRHPNQLTCNHLLASERIYKLIYTCSISSLRLYYWHVFNAFIRCLS